MQYILKSEIDYNKCCKYLIKNGINYSAYNIKDYFVINIFDFTLKQKIEDEEKSFLNSENISIENGYLVSKSFKNKTVIDVKGARVGVEKPVVISGPCSIETEDILMEIAREIKNMGVDILRGGAFKARTSPYDFQGHGRDAIDMLYNVGVELDMPVISEIVDIRDLDYMLQKVDILQVGSRNMYNYALLKELGKVEKPILLKRGFSATIKEFLLSAEYIMLGGNENVILCERGIRAYEPYTRNTLDISAISLLKQMTHLPIISDPSHATGKSSLVKSLSKASIAAGADGLMIESHINPKFAWSDGEQSVDMRELRGIVDFINS